MTKTKTKTGSETETKEQKQISIDLDTIFNPNPKLVQTYKDANAMDYWVDKDRTSTLMTHAYLQQRVRSR